PRAQLLLPWGARRGAAPAGGHPDPVADHGARGLPAEAARGAEGLARRADHHERRQDRWQLVQLVRVLIQMRWLQRQGYDFRQRAGRQIRPLPAIDRAKRSSAAGGGDPARYPGELLFRAGVSPRFRQCHRAQDCGDEMAGYLSDDHDGLRLPLGRHYIEGAVAVSAGANAMPSRACSPRVRRLTRILLWCELVLCALSIPGWHSAASQPPSAAAGAPRAIDGSRGLSIAEAFVRNSSTFRFDGIEDSLRLES